MTEAPGWDALDHALGGDAGEPVRFDVETGDGAPSIASVVAFAKADHWLYATYGLTELYEKSSDDGSISGHGYELVVRVPKSEGAPAAWPAELLRAVAGYVDQTGAELGDGHYIDVGEPIGHGLETKLTALVVLDDPALRPFDGPFGRVKFLTLVGITTDELELLLDWSAAGLAGELARDDASLVTRTDRASLLDSARGDDIRARASREGSSLERLGTELVVEGDPASHEAGLALEPSAVDALARVLQSRLAHGRPIVVDGENAVVELVPGDDPRWERTLDGLRITVPVDLALAWRDELFEQPPGHARALMSDLWVRIVPRP